MVRASEGAALVTIAQVQPIFVIFTVPQENQHKIREKQAQAPLVVQAYRRGRQDAARRPAS